MWSAGPDPWDLYIGAQVLGWCRPGAGASWAAGTEDDLDRALVQLARHARRPRVRVWLSGHLARPFLVPAMHGLRGPAEARALAEARAPEATGLAAPCRVWMMDGAAGATGLAVAVETQRLQHLLAAAQAAGVRLATVRPWWARALDQALAQQPDTDLYTGTDTDALTLLAGRGDARLAAETHTPAPASAPRAALVTRRALGVGLPAPRAWHALLDRDAGADAAGWPAVRAVGAVGAVGEAGAEAAA